MMVLHKEGKVMVWRNVQTTHPSLHLYHLLALVECQKTSLQWKGLKFQLTQREGKRFIATRGLQGDDKHCLKSLEALAQARMSLRSIEQHQRLHLGETVPLSSAELWRSPWLRHHQEPALVRATGTL